MNKDFRYVLDDGATSLTQINDDRSQLEDTVSAGVDVLMLFATHLDLEAGSIPFEILKRRVIKEMLPLTENLVQTDATREQIIAAVATALAYNTIELCLLRCPSQPT